MTDLPHTARVTHEVTSDGVRFYVDCTCGAEAGPFDTAAGARAADPHTGVSR